MELISLFSGAGGMDYGFLQAGHKILLAVDKNINACETYRKNLGLELLCKNVKNVKEFPAADLLVACCPCQGFSLFGTRKFNDERNFLYKEIVRCLKAVKPKFFITENVRGLLSLYKRKFFEMMTHEFQDAGYKLNWRLVNAKYYGVPQDRLRVFIVGIRKDLNVKFAFPRETHRSRGGPDIPSKPMDSKPVFCELGSGDNDYSYKPLVDLKQSIGDMRTNEIGEYWDNKYFSFFYMSRNRRRQWNKVSYTIQANPQHVPLHPSCPPMKKVAKDKWVFTGDIAKYRRLSVRECARIQTFPDHFTFEGGLRSQYRQIGNAVPPLIAYKFGQVFKLLEKECYEGCK
ncbi:MAG: DNA cytosine methyltransferase [Candidatus Hodarchaeota archaeon]